MLPAICNVMDRSQQKHAEPIIVSFDIGWSLQKPEEAGKRLKLMEDRWRRKNLLVTDKLQQARDRVTSLNLPFKG